MSRSNVGIAVFAVGVAALGFALGQYVESRSGKGAAPQAPKGHPPAPKYTVQATFELDDPIGRVLALPPVGGSLAEVLAEKDTIGRAARLATLLSTAGPERLPEVHEALERAGEMRGPELFLLVQFWAKYEPAEATRWALERSPFIYRAGNFVSTIEAWAAQDAAAAGETLWSIGKVQETDMAEPLRVLVRVWFQTGQPGLETFIRDLGMTDSRQRALRTFFSNALERDGRDPAARWAEAISDEHEKFKVDAFRQLASALTERNPTDGAAWCDAHCEGPYGGAIRMIVAQIWARQDGPAAMKWVSQAPKGIERDSAAMGAVRGWSRTDLEGLHAWARKMGHGSIEPWFQPAVPLLASTFRPDEAMPWAGAIQDPEIRYRTLAGLARQWRKHDPAAADAWLAGSSLPEEWRQLALGPVGRRATPAASTEEKPDTDEGGEASK